MLTQAEIDSQPAIDGASPTVCEARGAKIGNDSAVLVKHSAATDHESPIQSRGIRSCTRNTPNYFETHKGINPNQLFKARRAPEPDSAPVVRDFDPSKVVRSAEFRTEDESRKLAVSLQPSEIEPKSR